MTMARTAYRVAFAHGVCAALAVLAHGDDETRWREIVAANGGYDYLRGVSKRAGNLASDGFTRYERQQP
jgi:hypothetical protein